MLAQAIRTSEKQVRAQENPDVELFALRWKNGSHLFGKRLKNHIFGFTWLIALMQTIKYSLFKEKIFRKIFHDASITSFI